MGLQPSCHVQAAPLSRDCLGWQVCVGAAGDAQEHRSTGAKGLPAFIQPTSSSTSCPLLNGMPDRLGSGLPLIQAKLG